MSPHCFSYSAFSLRQVLRTSSTEEPSACTKGPETILLDLEPNSDPGMSLEGGSCTRQSSDHGFFAFRSQSVFSSTDHTALVCILLFAWLESFPLVFKRIYGFSQGIVGLTFIGLLCGAILATPMFIVWFRSTESKNFNSNCR